MSGKSIIESLSIPNIVLSSDCIKLIWGFSAEFLDLLRFLTLTFCLSLDLSARIFLPLPICLLVIVLWFVPRSYRVRTLYATPQTKQGRNCAMCTSVIYLNFDMVTLIIFERKGEVFFLHYFNGQRPRKDKEYWAKEFVYFTICYFVDLLLPSIRKFIWNVLFQIFTFIMTVNYFYIFNRYDGSTNKILLLFNHN